MRFCSAGARLPSLTDWVSLKSILHGDAERKMYEVCAAVQRGRGRRERHDTNAGPNKHLWLFVQVCIKGAVQPVLLDVSLCPPSIHHFSPSFIIRLVPSELTNRKLKNEWSSFHIFTRPGSLRLLLRLSLRLFCLLALYSSSFICPGGPSVQQQLLKAASHETGVNCSSSAAVQSDFTSVCDSYSEDRN